MQEKQPNQKIQSILQETQAMSTQFFGFIEMMQAYFNQRIAETMLNVQEQEKQLVELKKGQAEEDIKLCQLISQNQTISQSIQRQIDSLNDNNHQIFIHHSQATFLSIEDRAGLNQMSERQQVLEDLVQQAMNAIDVGVKVEKQSSTQYQTKNSGFHN